MKTKNGISQLLGYAGNYKKLTVLGCVLAGIAAILGLVPYICVWLVARDVLIVFPNISTATGLEKWGWMALWFAIANVIVYFAALMCTHIAAFRTGRNIRKCAVSHIVTLPLGFFSNQQSGILRKQIDDNADLTEDLLAHKLPDLIGAIITPIASIVLLFVFDWHMGVLCLITMVLAFVSMMRMMSGENADFFHQYQNATEDMSGEAVEYVRGIPVVKVFQQTVHSFKAFYATIMSYSKLATDYALSCRKGQTLFLTAINGAFVLLIPAAIILFSRGNGLSVLTNFIFYALFAPACGGMINRIMFASESVMEADEAMIKLNLILEQKPLDEPSESIRPSSSQISFENVTFTYPEALKPALEKIHFSVPNGSTVALVGPSGGGKTTAASLIPRFWDVQEGAVKIGDVDVKMLNNKILMEYIAFVFQDTHLFKKSLYDNISLVRPNATREEVLAAAHAAQCDDILAKLPNGLDTIVGTKGVYLSGGESQRIALARAILKDAPIIVLDEATAFADPENESHIQKAFEKLMQGKTVLMIAHRLSTIQHADNILVLNEGHVVEQGKHEELLKQKGIYYSMWKDYQKSAQWKVEKGVIV